jgi:hypothetical protein
MLSAVRLWCYLVIGEHNQLSPDLIRPLQLSKHQNLSLGRLVLWAYIEHDINAISARAEEDGEEDYLNDEIVYIG